MGSRDAFGLYGERAIASSSESSPVATDRPRPAIARTSSSDRSANARSATSPWPGAIVVAPRPMSASIVAGQSSG